MRAVGPLDVELLLPLYGGPGVVGKNSHAAVRLENNGRFVRIERDGLLDAGDSERGFVVQRFDRAAKNGRMRDIGVEHAVHVRVNAVGGFTGDHIFQVVAGNTFAHVTPFAARLELQFFLFGDGKLCGGGDQFAVSDFFAGFFVENFVESGGAFRFR